MKTAVKYQVLLLALILMAFFLVIEGLFDRSFLAILLNSLTITTGIAVVATYIVPAAKGVWSNPSDRVTQMILGITLVFMALILNRTGVMFIRGYNGSASFSAIAFLVFVSGVLHISPQFAIAGRITVRLGAIITAIILSAVVLAIAVNTYNPHAF